MIWLLVGLIIVILLGATGFWFILKSRNIHIWLSSYIKTRSSRLPSKKQVRNVYFCIADHYEPYWGKADKAAADDRVSRWCSLYQTVYPKHKDSTGRGPVYSYFYPIEEYDEDFFIALKKERDEGRGDVELHLHHDNDTADNLRTTIDDFVKSMAEKFDFFRDPEEAEKINYAFIHGNWALDNSRPDGRWCGVDNELDILVETGCYMDMTMPSAPSDTQTTTINSIYFAKGREGCRKSHDKGRAARVGEWQAEERELLCVQGPLLFNWEDRKLGLIPKIENGELSADNPPTKTRVQLWGKANVKIDNDPEENLFIKVHTHGLNDANLRMFESGGLDNMFSWLEEVYSIENGYRLHYVTAREMYLRIRDICTAA